MNTQRLAPLRISALHLQQGLFASLALMITLIVVQQFAHWNQEHNAAQANAQIKQLTVHAAPFARATALVAKDVAMSLQSADEPSKAANEDAVEQTPRRESWVF